MMPRILIIAGSDSGGGAGIQADIKTVTMLGGHAMTALTALTAQNTLGVQRVMPVPAEMVIAQIESCVSDIGVDAVKIGMLGSAETAHAVADWLERFAAPRFPGEGRGPVAPVDETERNVSSPNGLQPGPGLRRGSEAREPIPIVFDPVMIATSGATLADPATIAAFARLMDLATIVTPNLPELAALGGVDAVLAHGCHLAVKGGHGEGARIVDRLLAPGGQVLHELDHARIDTDDTHGTGCTFASALATGLARGLPLDRAFGDAVRFVRIALRNAPGLGQGNGPMDHALGHNPFEELEG